MIQPNGSIVEITGGPAAALVAAYLWSRLWIRRFERQPVARNSLSTQLPVSPHTRAV